MLNSTAVEYLFRKLMNVHILFLPFHVEAMVIAWSSIKESTACFSRLQKASAVKELRSKKKGKGGVKIWFLCSLSLKLTFVSKTVRNEELFSS
jgi:hypothetical protein